MGHFKLRIVDWGRIEEHIMYLDSGELVCVQKVPKTKTHGIREEEEGENVKTNFMDPLES